MSRWTDRLPPLQARVFPRVPFGSSKPSESKENNPRSAEGRIDSVDVFLVDGRGVICKESITKHGTARFPRVLKLTTSLTKTSRIDASHDECNGSPNGSNYSQDQDHISARFLALSDKEKSSSRQ